MPRTETPRSPAPGNPARRRTVLWVAFVVAVLVQLGALYLPSSGSPEFFPQADKVAHVLLFAIVVTPALLLRLPRPLVLSAAIAHAGISEMVQLYWIPGRDGDGWDMVADVVGIGLGVFLAHVWRRFSVRPSSRTRLR